MTKKRLLQNQILTDIGFWLEEFGRLSDEELKDKNQSNVDWYPLVDDAVRLLPKVKNYLTMTEE